MVSNLNSGPMDGGGFKGSQEWEVLNLLRSGQRDSFEERLQTLRRQRLTGSPSVKIAFCKLINHVIRIDGQYAAALIEDISHMLNDANITVQNETLATFASTAEVFLLNIFLSDCYFPNNEDIKNSIADLACTRHMVHKIILNNNACDINLQSGYIAICRLVHNCVKYAWANALRVVMYELALVGKVGVIVPRAGDDDKRKFSAGTNVQEWYIAIRNNPGLVNMISQWAAEDLALLDSCIKMATKSKKLQVIIRGIMAAEVSTTLISHYPECFFDHLSHTLVGAMPHLQETCGIYQVFIMRLFCNEALEPYHPALVEHLNSIGLECTLEEMYAKSRFAATCNFGDGRAASTFSAGAIDLVSAIEATHGIDALVNYATSGGNIAILDGYEETSAVRLFECDANMIKHMAALQQEADDALVRDCNIAAMRLQPPNAVAQDLKLDTAPIAKKQMKPLETGVEIQATSTSEITEHYPLYVTLLVTQIMDTRVSYKWHQRSNIISCPTIDVYGPFSSSVLYKLFLNDAVPTTVREKLYKRLLDHIAQIVLLERVSSGSIGSNKLMQIFSSCDGIGSMQLMSFVANERSLNVFELYLERVHDAVMHKANVQIARGLVLKGGNNLNDLLGSDAQDDDDDDDDDAFYGKQGALAETCTSANLGASDEQSLSSYSLLVNVIIRNLYSHEILDLVELRDVYIQQLCKFILNLPHIPLKLVQQLYVWLYDPQSVRLSFSLVSNLLKKSTCPRLKRKVLLLFLQCIVSTDANVKQLFLKLIASPKGLYQKANVTSRYSISELEAIHDDLVDWLLSKKKCPKCKAIPNLTQQVCADVKDLSLSCPLWQWPQGLIQHIVRACVDAGSKCPNGNCIQGAFQSKMSDPKILKGAKDPDWNLLASVWMEELMGLLIENKNIIAHPFLTDIVETVTRRLHSDDTSVSLEPFEAIVVAASRNPRLVFVACAIANGLSDQLQAKAAQCCHVHINELLMLFRYTDDHVDGAKGGDGDGEKGAHNLFLVRLLSQVRTLWLDPRYQLNEKWHKDPCLERELLLILAEKMQTFPLYILELSPFLSLEQLERLISFLFFEKGDDDAIKRILELVLSAPTSFKQDQKQMNFALPQVYMYAVYKLAAQGVHLKRQTALLDFCIESCVSGSFTVEAALSACTFIVESKDVISPVFGRVLCQMVQKIPLARAFVINTILPVLISRQAWQQQALWRGVVICLGSLWPGHKEPICKILLQLPQPQAEVAIKTLQTQHNATAYMAAKLSQLETSVHVPQYIKDMLSI